MGYGRCSAQYYYYYDKHATKRHKDLADVSVQVSNHVEHCVVEHFNLQRVLLAIGVQMLKLL